jgi:predicted dehydrogenase
MINRKQTRREFLAHGALAAAGASLAGCACGPQFGSKLGARHDEKLNVAFIGAGGRAVENIDGMKTENIVAFCDVDDERAAKSYAKYPDARRYKDYRKMLEVETFVDAVVVTVPDHSHAIAAIAAMRHGKHVYCEKPLAHSIYEARKMRDVARETGVVTQMGQQGHGMEGTRRAVEVIRSGAIGEVHEIHVWTDRPAGWWPQGEPRPTDTPPVPETLDWDLWLGPAPWRPYNPVYVPFKWRGRWDFGTGPIGDMGVHNLDPAYWALDPGLPISAEVVDSDKKTNDCPPLWSILKIEFPAKEKRGPVTLYFYDGKKLPPAELFMGEGMTDNGSLIIGKKGTLYTRTWHGGESPADMFLLLPRKEFTGYVPPAPTIPRVREHHDEFIAACKGKAKTLSPFSYASALTESLLVGQLALRTGRKIEWDAARMRAKGFPEADKYIHPEFRKDWEI